MDNMFLAERPLRILHLEDSPLDAELVREQLIAGGLRAQMDTAPGKQEFTAFLQRGGYDLILADYSIPDFDAFGALALTKTLSPGTPFICVSGAIGEEKAVELLRQGATDYVMKSRLDKLLLVMERALRENRDHQANLQLVTGLRASENRYRRLFESAKDGILILDAETGMIVDVNPFLIEMLGFSKEAFLEKNLWQLGFIRSLVANRDNFVTLQKTNYIRYEDLPLETADGRQIDVEFISNVYTVDGKRVIQCNIRDIRERKQVHDALRLAKKNAEAAVKAKSDFLNSIAHDFRTPVHAILGFSAFLLSENLTKKQHDLAGYISRSGQSLLRLVEELLDISRLESGGIVLRNIEFDLGEVVRSAYEVPKVMLEGKPIAMTCSIDEGIPRLKGDTVRLGQIIFNLIGNAVKFTEQGAIAIKVWRETDGPDTKKCRINLSVKDTGIGIPQDRQDEIFTPFVQLQEFRGPRECGGVGLGLYITRTLVHLMKGEIRVLSEPGAGSEFTVILDFDIV